MEIPAKTDEGVKDIKMCKVCGFLSGMDMVVPPETIDKIEESTKILAIEKRLWKEFLDIEDKRMQEFLKDDLANGLQWSKIERVHSAGMSFSQRFELYAESKKDDILKEIRKTDS